MNLFSQVPVKAYIYIQYNYASKNSIFNTGSTVSFDNLKVIYHPLYGMINYALIWGDWLSCDPLT